MTEEKHRRFAMRFIAIKSVIMYKSHFKRKYG